MSYANGPRSLLGAMIPRPSTERQSRVRSYARHLTKSEGTAASLDPELAPPGTIVGKGPTVDPNDIRWQPIEAESARLEVEHGPPATETLASAQADVAATADVGATVHRMSLRRMIGTLVLAGGLLAVGGASVAMAASPQPSASTAPSTQGGTGAHGYGSGSTPGGCHHTGGNSSGSGSGGSGGSSSPSSTSGA
jgi:hypothetical protein